MCRCFEYFIGTIMIYSLFPSVPFIAPCVTPYGSTVGLLILYVLKLYT